MDAGFNQHYLTRHEITLGRRSEAESSKVLLLTRCQELRGNFIYFKQRTYFSVSLFCL